MQCTPWPQIFFISFLTYEYQKNAEFYADFKSVEIIWKKVYLEKVIWQKLVQVSSIEEAKLQFCTLLLPGTFLLANFLRFSQQIPNQRKILSCFDPILKFCEEKVFRSY